MATALSHQSLILIFQTSLNIKAPADVPRRDTCVGQTQKMQRCQNLVSLKKRKLAADEAVEKLPQVTTDQQALLTALVRIAKLTLCTRTRKHLYQAEVIAQKWLDKIAEQIARESLSSTLPGQPTPPIRITTVEPPTQPPSPPATPQQHKSTLVASSEDNSNATSSQGVSTPTASTKEVGSRAIHAPHSNTCHICKAVLTEPVTTPSGHMYCSGCISKWLINNKTCRLLQLAHKVEATTQHEYDGDEAKSTQASSPERTAADHGTCHTCKGNLTEPVSTPTGHKFCKECISKWLIEYKTRRFLQLAHKVEPETECDICYEEFNKLGCRACRTPCGHFFCRKCLMRALLSAPDKGCPKDRRLLSERDLFDVAE